MLYLHSKHLCLWRCNTCEPRALYIACIQTNSLDSFTHDWFHSFSNNKTRNGTQRLDLTLESRRVVLWWFTAEAHWTYSTPADQYMMKTSTQTLAFLFLQCLLKRALMCSECRLACCVWDIMNVQIFIGFCLNVKMSDIVAFCTLTLTTENLYLIQSFFFSL